MGRPQLEAGNTSSSLNFEHATWELPVEIIPQDICERGLEALREKFIQTIATGQISVIPILQSGAYLGKKLTQDLQISINPMRMSYYNKDSSRREKPICLLPPDISQILNEDGTTKNVVFAECVVESQNTILAAMQQINSQINMINDQNGKVWEYPIYHTFAIISKTGDNKLEIPNLTAAFTVDQRIWVCGLGCDLTGDVGRELPYLKGILSPFAKEIPQQPFYTPLF